MKTLKDFIKSFKYNKYSDDLLNYSYEDFCEDKIVETLFGEDDKIYSYLDYQFIKYLQGDEYDMYSKYQQLLYESKNVDNKIITLSPRISEDMTDKVYNESNGIAYHICPNYVVDKILENGLRPKGGKNSKIYKNRLWHPKSIYVIFDKADNNTKNYFKQEIENDKISNEYDDNILKTDDVTILKIDLNRYNRKLKFYKDTSGGKTFIYTKEYIPPQCVSIYKENKVKKFIKELFKL